MLIVTSAAEAMQRQRRVHVNGKDYTLSEFVGAMPTRGAYEQDNEVNDNGLPQGFLVEQPPGSTTPAHFHEPNQFQVFVDGSGRLGAKPAVPLTVQYANGHTPYGPIVAGPQGLKYFTLRQRWDPGAKYLPGALTKLQKGRQRTRMMSGLGLSSPEVCLKRRAPQTDTVFETEADGLASYLFRVAPGERVLGLPDPREGGGQYLLVVMGEAVHGERTLPRLSAIFASHDERPPNIMAGPAGLELLVLQFPQIAA
jgi:hypothetical protein